jgi:Phytanoyl-CoA dioxygenase (PhyH)
MNDIDEPLAGFLETGIAELGVRFDPNGCRELLARVRARREFGPHLFLSEAEFREAPQLLGVSPQPGRNLIEPFDEALVFIEQEGFFADLLDRLLGRGWAILRKKLVCAVPEVWMPPWLLERVRDYGIPNLGGFIRPEYRDVTYFHGIDFHQDLIDWAGRTADFVTLYVYLDEVTPTQSPLHVLAGSHCHGGAIFPLAIERLADGGWRYTDDRGRTLDLPERVLTGPPGSAATWHPCVIHGTKPNTGTRERLSLRYLVARGPAGGGLLDELNARIDGPLRLDVTQRHRDADGNVVLKGNTLAESGS